MEADEKKFPDNGVEVDFEKKYGLILEDTIALTR